MTLTIGSLFSGIGGLDLGLERAGMTVRWQSEIDPYCARVLAKHWPAVPNLGDVTSIEWSEVEPVDLICGGYPCQPFSFAGSRGGSADARHLWPHFADALRVLRPRLALLENVPGHLSLGFDTVLSDLADLGYDTEWDCIPAAAVGAPHLRYRIFVVAHADGGGRPWRSERDGGARRIERRPGQGTRGDDADGLRVALADTEGEPERAGLRPSFPPIFGRRRPCDLRRARLAWAAEPDVGRVADGVPARVDRLRGLGNAVVPQVAEWLGRRILEAAA